MIIARGALVVAPRVSAAATAIYVVYLAAYYAHRYIAARRQANVPVEVPGDEDQEAEIPHDLQPDPLQLVDNRLFDEQHVEQNLVVAPEVAEVGAHEVGVIDEPVEGVVVAQPDEQLPPVELADAEFVERPITDGQQVDDSADLVMDPVLNGNHAAAIIAPEDTPQVIEAQDEAVEPLPEEPAEFQIVEPEDAPNNRVNITLDSFISESDLSVTTHRSQASLLRRSYNLLPYEYNMILRGMSPHLLCNETGDMLGEPVRLCCGHCFNKQVLSLLTRFANPTCPRCAEGFAPEHVVIDQELKSEVEDAMQAMLPEIRQSRR